MTAPVAQFSSADTWTEFMATHAPTGQRIVKDGPVPWRFGTAPNVLVDKQCTRCGRADHWKLQQVVGETPGIPAMPMQGSGVIYCCGLCGCTEEYRERPATDAERAERLANLAKAALKP